ncbi:hypothetical protein BGZ72_001516 [Mortierella alpina]|nr:hypothetical protein BGZ72_001516 [Mortierella alpina]
MPANCSHLGLSLTGPLVLNVLTAPADRIRLFLQTQDEIILNLREESLAHHQHAAHASPTATTPTPRKHSCLSSDTDHNSLHQLDDQDSPDTKNDRDDSNTLHHHDEDEDEDDTTPRSIIVPYAQLPYTDMKDCFSRLVEKEGQRSLWRGYSAECARLLVQAGVERGLRRRKLLDVRAWFSTAGTPVDVSSLSLCGNVAWILCAAVEGTLMSAVALAVVYPLATVQTKMATDVIRRTRQKPKRILSSPPSSSLNEVYNSNNSNNNSDINSVESENSSKPYETDINSSSAGSGPGSMVLLASESEPSPRDSVEWFEHAEEDEDDKKAEQGETPEEGFVPHTTEKTLQERNDYYYTLSYKYHHHKDIFQSTVATEGYWGLYKGFSTVLVSTFVSRFATLSLVRLITATILRSSGTSSSSSGLRGALAGLGTYLVVWGAATAVNMLVYPLSTICHRRMIASPGRYTSSWDTGKQIVEKQGWRALYNGVEVAMLKGVVIGVLSKIF